MYETSACGLDSPTARSIAGQPQSLTLLQNIDKKKKTK